MTFMMKNWTALQRIIVIKSLGREIWKDLYAIPIKK